MRTLSSNGQAAVAAGALSPVLLAEFDLDGGMLALNMTRLDLVINGTTYLGTWGLGQVGSVTNTPGEMPKLQFTFSGVPSDKIAFARTENVRGREVRLKLALYSLATKTFTDVVTRYAGWLDVLSIADGKDGAAISVTSESGTRDLLRASNVYYSHEDQQATAPGDLFFQYQNAQVERRIVFPAQSWFLKHK